MERTISDTDDRPVLVTGAAGFIGRAVCAELRKRGRRFIAMDMRPAEDGQGEITLCDLTDIHRLYAITERTGISAILHCGAVSGPMLARDNPRALIESNVAGTANVLELARIRGISRVVIASSASVFGPTSPAPVREDAPPRPTTVYAATKLASESLATSYSRQFGLNTVCLRLAWVYGPYRRTDCVIRTMIEDALHRRPTRFPFGRDFPRQFLYIDDAASALLAALERPELSQQVYTITGGEYVTLGELGDIVRRHFPDADIHLEAGPAPEDDLQQAFDISAARKDLGYRPGVSLDEGVGKYATWLASAEALGVPQ